MPLFYNNPWDTFSTREFSWEAALVDNDEITLETLRDLTSSRKLAVDVRTGHATDAATPGERALAGLERYIPILEKVTQRVEISDEVNVEERKKDAVSFHWNSPLGDNVAKPKFYQLRKLQHERAMVLNLYAIAQRKRASELVVGTQGAGSEAQAVEALQGAVTMFRRAAGVYDYLASTALPPLKEGLAADRPAELLASMAEVMSATSLAEAQAVAVHRAELKRTSPKLVASLHLGVGELFDTAVTRLRAATGDFNDVAERLKKFIALGSSLHTARAYKAYAQQLKADGEVGQAIGILAKSRKHLQDCLAVLAQDDRWTPFVREEDTHLREEEARCRKENEMVYFQSVPEILPPLPPAKGIVSAIAFAP